MNEGFEIKGDGSFGGTHVLHNGEEVRGIQKLDFKLDGDGGKLTLEMIEFPPFEFSLKPYRTFIIINGSRFELIPAERDE